VKISKVFIDFYIDKILFDQVVNQLNRLNREAADTDDNEELISIKPSTYLPQQNNPIEPNPTFVSVATNEEVVPGDIPSVPIIPLETVTSAPIQPNVVEEHEVPQEIVYNFNNH
jgi:hypothetical protein